MSDKNHEDNFNNFNKSCPWRESLFENLKAKTVHNICRICLSVYNDEKLQSLINSNDEECLREKFVFVTSIDLNDDDCLPTNICYLCSSELLNSFMFKSKAEESDNVFHYFLKNEIDECRKYEAEQKINYDSIIKDQQIKDEDILNEEVEYLEDFSDNDCESAKFILPNNEELENKINVKVSISDSETQCQKPKRKYFKRKQNTLECKLCTKTFLKQKTLRAHVLKDHGPDLLPNGCQVCKQSFTSEYDLKIHSSIHDSLNGWKCNKCGKQFKDKTTLRRHLQRHMRHKRYSCSSCGKTFSESYALRKHSRVHTGETVEKKHKCNICEKRYDSARALASHIAQHAGVRPYVCAVCGKTFPNPRLLGSHRIVHSDDKQYACSYCDKRFRHESTRNTHHRTHTGEKPYICSFCGKRFIQSSNLSRHLRTHTGEQPYSCDVCQRKFSSGSSLKVHRRIHTGEKPYSCDICGLRFARLDRRAHLRTHTGEKPFQCSVCRKKFVAMSSLKEHRKLHTGEKPYECDTCSTKFSSKARLGKHIKTHQAKVKTEKKSTPKSLYLQPISELNDARPVLPRRKQYYKEETEEHNGVDKEPTENANETCRNISVIMETPHVVPMEVSRELIIHPDGETKTELLVVDEANYQGNLRLAENIEVLNDNVKFVKVDSDVAIPVTSVISGTTVKFMQLDQSLLQIQSENGHLTVSKITSKMTANF